MAWERIGPGIAVARPLEELRAAFARTDLFALDLDQCIFPRISQEALGEGIALRLLRGPGRRLLPRMLVGGAYRALTHLKRFFGARTPAARLIAWYEWTMRGVPEVHFRETARELPPRSYPFAAETIALLVGHAPTGVATLGLDVVARTFVEQLPGLSFFDANVVVFCSDKRPACRGVGRPASGTLAATSQPERGEERVFACYDHSRLLDSGEAKRQAVERRMAAVGASVPTIIGHNEDDAPLARLARERGGLAIGFNPSPRVLNAFDAIATGPDWEAMYALVAILEGARPRRTTCPAPSQASRQPTA